MARPKIDQSRAKFQVWLTGEDADRYEEVLKRAFARQPRAPVSVINRRLLGLDYDEDLLTDDDINFFRREVDVNSVKANQPSKEDAA